MTTSGMGSPSRGAQARTSGENAETDRETGTGTDSDTARRIVVLIADDEEPIAETLALIVEDAGYASITALHGGAALDLVQRYHPALIITDLMMPYVDGRTFIPRLRQEVALAGWPPIPVILMTAADLAYARDCGADAILAKPFSVDEVEDLLRSFLRVSAP